ncbi:MAG: hypothetical protein K0S04_1601 [Herbinix sp.]|jgi:hypothetical protein|nr:hypothetical protein [Herbinix sp.]
MKTFVKVWLGIALMALGFGVVILGIAFVIGNSTEALAEVSFKESYQNVESIDLQVAYGQVIIKNGDTFSIDATHMVENNLKSYLKDGTWYIKGDSFTDRRVFGINFSLGDIGRWNRQYNPKIVVTVPEGFQAESFNIDVGAGDVQIDSINAKEGDISVDAGRLTVDHIKIDNTSSYSVDAGQMTLNDVELKDISLDCGVGYITVNGQLTGENDISCDVGQIELSLKGDKEDYSYDIISDVGNVTINGWKYYNGRSTIDNKTGNNLNLDCGIGKITVDFQ